MKSTFKVLFYVKKQSVKNGKAPIMGRITINGTQAGFSCKKEVSLALWDVKANRARGKSEEARTLNQELDNIKAQITRHYQYICDHDNFVTAKKVYNRYAGFSEECHTLMNLFREQLESYKKKVGIEKAESTYRGLVADYKNLLLFMKSKKNTEDIVIEELEKSFIEDYYNWMLGTCALANSTAFGRVNTLKWLMYICLLYTSTSNDTDFKYLPGADGEKVSAWPRDEEGNVVATPLISVSSSGYWQVSYDNGQTYTSLGTKAEGGSQGGTSILSKVEYNEAKFKNAMIGKQQKSFFSTYIFSFPVIFSTKHLKKQYLWRCV